MQTSRIGNQTGGRVFLFLTTDNFERDYARMKVCINYGMEVLVGRFGQDSMQDAYLQRGHCTHVIYETNEYS